jgi:hypothetical protein
MGHIDSLIAFCASVVFVMGYSVIAPWWRYAVGRTMVSLDVGIALTLLPAVLHYWFGLAVNDAFFSWYEDLSLLLVAGITLWRLLTIYRLQQRARHNIHENGDEEA